MYKEQNVANAWNSFIPEFNTNLTYTYNHPNFGKIIGTLCKGVEAYNDTPWMFMNANDNNNPELWITNYALIAPITTQQ